MLSKLLIGPVHLPGELQLQFEHLFPKNVGQNGNTGRFLDHGQDVEALINGTRTLGDGLKARNERSVRAVSGLAVRTSMTSIGPPRRPAAARGSQAASRRGLCGGDREGVLVAGQQS